MAYKHVVAYLGVDYTIVGDLTPEIDGDRLVDKARFRAVCSIDRRKSI